MGAHPELRIWLVGLDLGPRVRSEEAGDPGVVTPAAPVVVLDRAPQPLELPLLLQQRRLGIHWRKRTRRRALKVEEEVWKLAVYPGHMGKSSSLVAAF